MKRYQIVDVEVKFLKEMIEYLSEEGSSISDKGSKQVAEVIDRIESRPVLATVIDQAVFEKDYDDSEVITNDD